MDMILKVDIGGEAQSELYRAVSNIDGVVVVNKFDSGYRLQGDGDGFQALKTQLKEQEREEREYDQYEFARANQNARKALRKALREKQTEA